MRHSRWPYIFYAAGVLLLIGLWIVSGLFNIPIRQLIHDPAQVAKMPFYIGFMSNLTITIWAIGAYITLFTAWLLGRLNADQEWLRFFKLAGILTLILMLDDLFMFHDQIFPEYLFFSSRTGIEPNEKFVLAGYAIFGLWFLYSSRRTIFKTDWLQLMIACAILGFGILADRGIAKIVFPVSSTRAFIEDAAKFLGVLGWSLYFLKTAKAVILMHIPATAAIAGTAGSAVAPVLPSDGAVPPPQES